MDILIVLIAILLENIDVVIKYAKYIVIIIVIYFIWKKIINPIIEEKVEEYKRKQKLQFNEFSNIEKIEQQQEENEQLENEWEATKKSYSTSNKEEILEGVPIASILEDDNAFDAELFKKWSRNIFLYLQNGKEEELKQIKPSMSEDFFDRKIQMLRSFEKDNIELKREDLLIEEIKILDYAKWMDKAQIKIYIKARLKEYIINKTTQKVLRGNYKKASERGFIMTFQKKDGEQQVGFVRNCQSCGATIAETEFGRCQYCGSLVNPIRYNWTLIKYEVI